MLTQQCRISKTAQRRITRLFCIHARSNVLSDLVFKMKAKLIIKPRASDAAPEERLQSNTQLRQPTHRSPPYSLFPVSYSLLPTPCEPYSVLSACIGFIREARHAGTRHASAATSSNVAATAANTSGSSGCVRYSID
jgi:hypothetical protein